MRRFIGTAALLGVLLFSVQWAKPTPQQSRAKRGKVTAAASAAYGNADAITEEELRIHEYFLASDQLEGRNLPSRGYDAAALYIAGHLKEWGLQPGGSTSGTNGPLQPYFMPFELVSNQYETSGMKLVLNIPPPRAGGGRGGAGGGRGGAAAAYPPGPHSFEYGREWIAGGGLGGFGRGGRGGGAAAPADIVDARMVFVGNGYVIKKTNADPYRGVDVRGKILVVAGFPPEMAAAQQAAAAGRGAGGPGGGRGAAIPNPLGTENTDFITPQGYAAKNGALGIIMIPTFQQLVSMSNPSAGFGGRGAGLNGPPYQVVKFQSAGAPPVPVITAGVDLVNSLFQGEKLNGAQVFDGAAANSKLDSFELNPEKTLSLRIATTSGRDHGENVIAMLEGSDPVLKGEYVVMTAHLDHVGLTTPDSSGDGINNGADDDASGCAALMAIARAYAEGAGKGIRPKRTMIFLWVGGEEKGLWGSQYFNQFPPIDITKVVVDLNMDMIGRTKPPGYTDPPSYKLAEPKEIFVVGPNVSSDDLDKIIEKVNDGYEKLKISHFYDVTAPDATHDNLGPGQNGQRIFYRSDHYNFSKMGIPIAFFTTGLHPDYHRVTDSPEKIDYGQMQAVAKTVAAIGWAIANTPNPPKLNANLPERLVNDMKTAKEQGWGKLTPVLPPLPGMPF